MTLKREDFIDDEAFDRYRKERDAMTRIISNWVEVRALRSKGLMEGMSEEALDSLEDDMYGSGRPAI